MITQQEFEKFKQDVREARASFPTEPRIRTLEALIESYEVVLSDLLRHRIAIKWVIEQAIMHGIVSKDYTIEEAISYALKVNQARKEIEERGAQEWSQLH